MVRASNYSLNPYPRQALAPRTNLLQTLGPQSKLTSFLVVLLSESKVDSEENRDRFMYLTADPRQPFGVLVCVVEPEVNEVG